MNTKNNRRRQETVNKIENVFLAFLKEQELSQIKVKRNSCQRIKETHFKSG